MRWVDLDGVVIVLDERCGRYFALPPRDAPLWHAVASGGAPPPEPEFLAELRRRGWIAGHAVAANARRGPRAMPSAPWRTALALRAWWCLMAAELRLGVRGFSAAYGDARASASRTVAANEISLAQALGAFGRAEHLMVSRRGVRDCLPRTLALFVFLRRCGFGVVHRIGVQRHPFAAHAWVEDAVTGVVLDAEERIRRFTPLANLP